MLQEARSTEFSYQRRKSSRYEVWGKTDFVDIDGRAVVDVLLEVVVTHTDFTEITRVVLQQGQLAGQSRPLGPLLPLPPPVRLPGTSLLRLE